MSVPNSHEVSPRNSPLREVAARPIKQVVTFLAETFSWLTPNEVTLLGTSGFAALCMYTANLEKEGKLTGTAALKVLAAYFALSATDALDGALARHKKEQGETTHDSTVGQLVDSLSDRVQEAFSSWLAMYLAAERGDKLWLVTATLTALTNPLSSLVRAWAEARGMVVQESGSSPLEFLGTRVGRFATGTARMVPEIPISNTSVQGLVDGVTAVATVKTTASRLSTISQSSQDGEMQENAKKRFALLAGLAAITGTTTLVLLHALLKKKK